MGNYRWPFLEYTNQISISQDKNVHFFNSKKKKEVVLE